MDRTSLNGAGTPSAVTAFTEQSFRQAFDQAPIGLALVSLEGRFLRVNQSLADLLGYRPEELLELDFQQLTHPDDLELDLEYVRQMLAGERRTYQMEKRYIGANGQTVWALLDVSLLRNDDGEPEHFVSQIRDITERKALEQRLTYLASHDEMTGLMNRRRFDEDVRREIAQAKRYGHPAALLLMDLDNFKEINDTFGHAVGDELVKAVADRLRARLRDTDVVARVGGDEFGVLLPECEVPQAEHVATALVEEIAGEPFVIVGRPLWGRASIGVAPFDPQAPVDPKHLLISADRAMYEAKGRGGNGYAVAGASVEDRT